MTGPPLTGLIRVGAKAHVFVDDVGSPELGAGDRHHLEKVLRLRAGEVVTAADAGGSGRWRLCRFCLGPISGPGSGSQARLEPVGEVSVEPLLLPEVAVAFAPTKGDRPDWAVQKLTELSVDRIVPLVAARSVVRWGGDRAPSAVERLRRVAREAAMQSRRARLPVVEDVMSFSAVAARPGAALAAAGGGPPSLATPLVLVGPEGGWSPEEAGAGLPTMALGTGVLRTETAAVAAGTLLVALRAGLVSPR
jgi:16S rRNA (uracil1498-N3)-methyltransferase